MTPRLPGDLGGTRPSGAEAPGGSSDGFPPTKVRGRGGAQCPTPCHPHAWGHGHGRAPGSPARRLLILESAGEMRERRQSCAVQDTLWVPSGWALSTRAGVVGTLRGLTSGDRRPPGAQQEGLTPGVMVLTGRWTSPEGGQEGPPALRTCVCMRGSLCVGVCVSVCVCLCVSGVCLCLCPCKCTCVCVSEQMCLCGPFKCPCPLC